MRSSLNRGGLIGIRPTKKSILSHILSHLQPFYELQLLRTIKNVLAFRKNGTYYETIQIIKIWDSSDPESSPNRVRLLPAEAKIIVIAWSRFCWNRPNTSPNTIFRARPNTSLAAGNLVPVESAVLCLIVLGRIQWLVESWFNFFGRKRLASRCSSRILTKRV
jgi:hypothetical protein